MTDFNIEAAEKLLASADKYQWHDLALNLAAALAYICELEGQVRVLVEHVEDAERTADALRKAADLHFEGLYATAPAPKG